MLTTLLLIGVVVGLRAIWAAVEVGNLLRLGRRPNPASLTFAPPTAVLAPIKGVAGLDPDLSEGLAGLLSQDHPGYRLLLILESASDPAMPIVEAALRDAPRSAGLREVRVVFAGPATDRGQKVHNLLCGLEAVPAGTVVLAFVDSDVAPDRAWLRRLIAPLADPAVGAATGYRWYVPIRGGPLSASALLSAWDSIMAAMFAQPVAPFAWGGSMALRTEVFEHVGVRQHWAGSISDDGGVSRALRLAGRAIAFAPGCLMVSRHDTSWAGLWEFVCRQFLIVRVYGPELWWFGLVFTAMYVITQFVTPLVAAVRLWNNPCDEYGWLLAGVVGLTFVATSVGGLRRARAAQVLFPEHADSVARARLLTRLAAWPVSLLNLAALLWTATTRRMTWRGIRYTLLSDSRVVIER